MTDKQGSSDVARVERIIAVFRDAYGYGSPGYEDADALTRVLAEREADQEALKRADELARVVAYWHKDLRYCAPEDTARMYRGWPYMQGAVEAFRAARSGEGR